MSEVDKDVIVSVQQDAVLLADRFHDLHQTLSMLARYAKEAEVREYAERGMNQLDLITRDQEVLIGAMKTALDVVKHQRDAALEEIDFQAEESYEEGYAVAMEDSTITDDDMVDSYNQGQLDGARRVEKQVAKVLGMTVEEAAQYIKESGQALKDWEAWAKSLENAA